jgi:hypothetical protein
MDNTLIPVGSIVKMKNFVRTVDGRGRWEFGLILRSYLHGSVMAGKPVQAVDILWDVGDVDECYCLGNLEPDSYEVIAP